MFFMSTWWGDYKKMQKNFFAFFLFFLNPPYSFWDAYGHKSENILGYDINYLGIWPCMRHPWFPTRKASKLTFVCFQLQLFSPCIVFKAVEKSLNHSTDWPCSKVRSLLVHSYKNMYYWLCRVSDLDFPIPQLV